MSSHVVFNTTEDLRIETKPKQLSGQKESKKGEGLRRPELSPPGTKRTKSKVGGGALPISETTYTVQKS